MKRHSVLIGADHNLDFLKHMQHTATELFINKLLDFNMIPCITRPTRITHSSATLIDNIFVSNKL